MLKVSVIVPIYNSEKFLENCLDSLINQTLDDYEVICVDDGSTDSSCAILNKYFNSSRKVRLLKNGKNMGLSYARNYGLAEATGEYVLFIDSDDWIIRNDSLSILYNTAKSNELELLRYRITSDSHAYINNESGNGKKFLQHLIENNAYKWESVRNFVKREFLLKNAINFDERMVGCEDILFSTLCLYYANRCNEISDAFYYYNRHEGSITQGRVISSNIRGNLLVIDRLYRLFSTESNMIFRYSLLNLISQVSQICEYSLWRLDESLDTSDWEDYTVALYNTICKGKLIDNHIIFKTWNKILVAKKIYIYGAGRASNELWEGIQGRICVAGIIVTHRDEKQETWNGITVYDVNDVQIDRTGLVLISISGIAKFDVCATLKENLFNNYLIIGK